MSSEIRDLKFGARRWLKIIPELRKWLTEVVKLCMAEEKPSREQFVGVELLEVRF